jgi:recombination protein RecA
MAKSEIKDTSRDSLASILHESINSGLKKGEDNIAHFLDGEGEVAANITDWISTGADTLDIAISNRPHGGLPVGRIVEITGLEASGKSLLAAHVIAETQKKGGIGVFIDTESAVSTEFISAIGVDLKKLIYVQMEALEDVYQTVENIVEKVRESDKDRLVTIVVDSVMGASTKKELAGDYDKEGWATDKAILTSKAMRKLTGLISQHKILLIFTNQLRQKLGVMFGDPWTTSGGKALAFHSSVRLRLKSMGQLKAKVNGVEQTIGIKTRCQVVKNRTGPPMRSAEFDIMFDSGINNTDGWLNVMKEYKLIKQGGAWYTYEKEDGEEVKFQAKDFANKLEEDPLLREEIYIKICDTLIMKYQSKNFSIDDIELSDEPIPED